MNLTFQHIISIIFTITLVTAVGIYSGRKVKSSSDFSIGGKKANWPIVTGTIMGTLIGGSSTIGTAQMAYLYGFSAWWFTLGAGLGCLTLGIFFVKPLWNSDVKTLPQILMNEYGHRAGLTSSIFTTIGMFLNIIAQVLSIMALLSTIFPFRPYICAITGIVLMAFYVIFGGVWGTGFVGLFKMLLLYLTMVVTGVLAYVKGEGLTGFHKFFPSYPWLSIFGRGLAQDMSAGFALIIGVLSTQTYIQAVISGKDVKSAKKGSLISAILIPPIGIAGIFIGLYMKKNFPYIEPAEALPLFILQFINPWIGGIALATLLVAIVGTGAGLALGISTILSNDIYKRIINKTADDTKMLQISRLFIVITLGLSLVFVFGNLKSLILQWSFLSMGLRGTVAFIPMITALFYSGVVPEQVGSLSILLGPLGLLAWKIFSPFDIDPLYIGILASLLTIICGNLLSRKLKKIDHNN